LEKAEAENITLAKNETFRRRLQTGKRSLQNVQSQIPVLICKVYKYLGET